MITSENATSLRKHRAPARSRPWLVACTPHCHTPMNHALPSLPSIAITARRPAAMAVAAPAAWANDDEAARLRRLRSLLALFSLYAGALLSVIVLSDGADVGCILAGIAGHVLYATCRMVTSWRDASWLEEARDRSLARRRTA